MNLLAWTTTPWTLLANVALAVNPKIDYALIAFKEDLYILANSLVERVFTNSEGKSLNIKSLKTFQGGELSDLNYQPLFGRERGDCQRVLLADYVTTEDGSGIVHVAPAYGEEDYLLAERFKIPIIKNIDDNGFYETGPWRGHNVWQVNEEVAQTLLDEGKVLK